MTHSFRACILALAGAATTTWNTCGPASVNALQATMPTLSEDSININSEDIEPLPHTIKIQVVKLSGDDTLTLEVESGITVSDLKDRISSEWPVNAFDELNLLLGNESLSASDGKIETALQENCIVTVTFQKITDIEKVLQIVNEDSLRLKYASDRFRDDVDVVRAAVRNNGMALQFSSVAF